MSATRPPKGGAATVTAPPSFLLAPARVWSEVVDWMAATHGMAELLPEDEAVILDYLVEHYGYQF